MKYRLKYLHFCEFLLLLSSLITLDLFISSCDCSTQLHWVCLNFVPGNCCSSNGCTITYFTITQYQRCQDSDPPQVINSSGTPPSAGLSWCYQTCRKVSTIQATEYKFCCSDGTSFGCIIVSQRIPKPAVDCDDASTKTITIPLKCAHLGDCPPAD